MNELKALVAWIVTSSADPKKTSLAVTGFLTLGGGYVLKAIRLACDVGLACLPIDSSAWSRFVEIAGSFTEGTMIALGAIVALIGLVRKWQNGRWSALQ